MEMEMMEMMEMEEMEEMETAGCNARSGSRVRALSHLQDLAGLWEGPSPRSEGPGKAFQGK
ncbi:hypothetical protein D623_10035638 [Myotis brandtii]|uniref:Uncharacterized protein n=1 Tax=Myotis brandtii TaxID=109478 RepID=S7MH03_MYOBR|nr:hypothetical protein D623_10035638 [Myotis brandtii]